MLRYSLVSINVLIVLAVLAFILLPTDSSDTNAESLTASAANGATINPLDTLSSSEIAATAAQLAQLPETTAIVNQADSDQAQLSMIASSNSVITKPQVVTSNYASNKDIQTYIVQNGDTLASVASKFDLSQNTIRWSNNLGSSILSSGQKLLIPPVDGVVYTVQSGDTVASLAAKYGASADEITAYNDAELKGLTVGEVIIIPGGSIAPPRPTYSSYGGYGFGGGFAFGSSAIYGYNGYDFGECTWYVATQIPVPANWGNAATWAYYAAQTPGWVVSSVPSVGAIAQNSYSAGGAGHVAIVVAVNGNQIEVRDMNGIAGWDRVGQAWQPVSTYQHFISR